MRGTTVATARLYRFSQPGVGKAGNAGRLLKRSGMTSHGARGTEATRLERLSAERWKLAEYKNFYRMPRWQPRKVNHHE
jgi:hypothetical protein